MNKSILYTIIIGSGALIFFLGYFFYDRNKPARELPYFGPREAGLGNNDTSYHTVSGFTFLNQQGKEVSEADFENKIYIADFFFTTCKGICIKMASQMQRVQKKYKGNPEVMILSHSVNPDKDSVPALAVYAAMHEADDKQWFFVTGKKKNIYDAARHSYLVVATVGDGGPEDFIHTENFVLVDKDKHIRGYYDGTDSSEVEKMMNDMDLLLKSYRYKEGELSHRGPSGEIRN